VVSAVLDEAMGHCAGRALGAQVVTTLLRVRFIGPTRPTLEYELQVRFGSKNEDSVAVEAELVRDGVVVAATARFRKLPDAQSGWRRGSDGQ
jgi:acyl-coenzyme A thioesterase PaaI-like protein